MKRKVLFVFLILLLGATSIHAQFGRNKVQYKGFTWYYIQTKHFDVYFNKEGMKVVEFAANVAEHALQQIQGTLHYKINNRIPLVLYTSQNDFQETNVIDQYLPEGVGGFTELFKNRVVVPFTGEYEAFRHVIHHELVHAVMNDMYYGGSIQNIIANSTAVQFPLWFGEGLCEFNSIGWNTEEDMFMRDAAINEYLPDISQMGGYFAYRGGQAVFYYIAETYGREKIGELMNTIKGRGSVEAGFEAAIGLKIKDLNERFEKWIKNKYWPDVDKFEYPEDFAKQLTDHEKDGGFYNVRPALSPRGDKIAFISNRDFYFDVYLMNAMDGEVTKKIIQGNRTADFEELNILTPGMVWSPDGKYIAIAAKSDGFDVIYKINAETEDIEELPFQFDGIGTIDWSPNGKYLAIAGQNAEKADIFVYDFETEELTNITNDVYSDSDPAWMDDSERIVFSSDRDTILVLGMSADEVKMYEHNYSQLDLYLLQVGENEVTRLTDLPLSNEISPVTTGTRDDILFISDVNGINNIYRKRIVLHDTDTTDAVTKLPQKPITNSMNGLSQLSLSEDGKKMTFTAMHEAAYNIFIINNPFQPKTERETIPLTGYMKKLLQRRSIVEENIDDTLFVDVMIPEGLFEDDSVEVDIVEETTEDSTQEDSFEFYSGSVIDSTAYSDSVEINFENFVFGQDDYEIPDTSKETKNENFLLTDNLDDEGNYKVNKYKINFTPDIIYANAGYSTFYGLLGTTVLSFSDLLGNHRLIGMTSLQIDLKNSDYGLAYYYLPNRLDIGVQGFHTARFLYIQKDRNIDLYRFRNFGGMVSATYPFDRFDRLDFGLSLLFTSAENLDDTLRDDSQNAFLIPSISYVHDNTIWGYTSPIDGSRYRFDFMANPIIDADEYGFYSFTGDYRNYNRFWYDYSFVYRFSFGYSGGANPQRFFLGGIENWINRKWATGEIPLEEPSDFAFLSAALPLRGYYYSEQIGSRYWLTNFELRFPLIRYLVSGALPILFQNILGVAFVDAGTAWSDDSKLQLFHHNEKNTFTTKDLLIGTGLGARMYFLYFLLRFDVAWSYDLDHFSKPIYYFSIGTDF